MSYMGYGSDIYRIFSPFFYDLVGLYEINFNRDPKRLVDYAKVPNSSEILPIYGESALPKYALYLAQLPIVNRLSEIKQLAYTYILFPGATHTRYEHSRGVMYKGLILLDKSRELLKKECQITLTEDDELIIGISGLLHDLGHSAWGHALDGISGYVVELLEEISYYLFSPKKIDTTITLYLLLKNEQISKAIFKCANIIKNKSITETIFRNVIAQIIIEEEEPFFDGLDEGNLIQKIHLFTTILGNYSGRNGINVDRLDWIVRDTHHANLIPKLDADNSKQYEQLIDYIKHDKYKIKIKDNEFFDVDNEFNSLLHNVRENIYSIIFEGPERSFTDSLLIRLAYSTIRTLQIIGDNIASPPVTTKAIMGYLMMNDYLIKDYTNKTLKLVKQNLNILDPDDPSIGFISNSNNLLILLENIKPIMHCLSDVEPQKIFYPKISLNYELIQIEQMNKKIIILTSEAFYDIIRKAWDTYKANDIDKIAVLYQDILSPTRINPIDNLKIALLESGLRQEFKGLEILILVNYYFFRELDDKFRNKISNIEDLKNILEKDFISTPFIFIILDNSCPQVEKILDKLYSDILSNFMSFFESIDIRVRSRKRK